MRLMIKSISAVPELRGATLSIKVEGNPQELLDMCKNGCEVEINKYRQKRSLNANGYCWVLSQKIADVLGTTKENVYRQHIRDFGRFETLQMDKKALDNFKKVWSSNGIGWTIDEVGETQNNTINILAYYGTSCYNTKEMAVFLDGLVSEAKELGIETLTPDELKRWGL